MPLEGARRLAGDEKNNVNDQLLSQDSRRELMYVVGSIRKEVHAPPRLVNLLRRELGCPSVVGVPDGT